MTLSRRSILQLATGAAAFPAASRIARAQAYPARPVRIIVPIAAGGGLDLAARLIGQWLSERLGQSFVIDNRPGGGSNIGTEVAVRAPADGYTLLLASFVNAVNMSLYDKLTFDFVRDICPSRASSAPHVIIANLSLPAKTIPELIAYAKANPGKLNMASPGNGTPGHVGGELFKMMAGVRMVHVPYRGGSLALPDLFSGQVQTMVLSTSASIEHIRAGTVRALAVTTSKRMDALPGIPTVAEFVPGFEAIGWTGIGAPKDTPPDIIDKLNMEITAGLADARIKARLADLGGEPMPMTSVEFGHFIGEEAEKWAKVVKFAGLKPD